MAEKANKQKGGTISEEDVSALLQRYTATTILALLQEVAHVPEVKIDWNALVEKTSTGISNAREYQMLWRHLVYRDTLLKKLDAGAQPLDDDSDLEYELEAFPTVSSEASTEAAAYVKVLIASGLPGDPNNGSTVEAPLTINIPCTRLSNAPSNISQLTCFMQSPNITIPVSVQKQPQSTSVEGLDVNGLANGNLPARRKRKPWSTAEDMELIAAVQKCGEGNWANILKEDFKGDRTASQLSQRWAIIRKRKGNLNLVGSSQLSEAQLATRRAVSLALGENLKAPSSINNGGANSNIAHNHLAQAIVAEAAAFGTQAQDPTQQDSVPTVVSQSGASGSSSKPQIASKNPSTRSVLNPDAMVKAAALAAGARIATPSDAASLLKAAQAKNAVHIMPGGGSLIKSSVASNADRLPSAHRGPNVHYIRAGLATTPLSTCSVEISNNSPPVVENSSVPRGNQQVDGPPLKSATLTALPNRTSNDPEPNMSLEATTSATLPTIEPEVESKEDIINSSSSYAPKKLIQEDSAGIVNPSMEEVNRAAFSGDAPEKQLLENQAPVSPNDPREHNQEDDADEQAQDYNPALRNSEAILKGESKIIVSSNCSSCPEAAETDQTLVISREAAPESENSNDSNLKCLRNKDKIDHQPAADQI